MFEHNGNKYYTAEEVVEMLDEFANKIDRELSKTSATELNEEIKEFVNSYNSWCGDLFYLGQFSGVGNQFNFEHGGDIDDWLDENLPKHSKLIETGMRYYSEAWFDQYEDCIHDDNDKVYNLKMAYAEELQKYTKEDEDIWIGYAEERTELTDYEQLECFRSLWLGALKDFKRGLENQGKIFFGRLMPKLNRTSADEYVSSLMLICYVEWFYESLQYGNMFNEKTVEQSRAIMKEYPDWLKYGFRYHFMKEAFINRMGDQKFEKILGDYLTCFNTTVEKMTEKYNLYLKKYEMALNEAFGEE